MAAHLSPCSSSSALFTPSSLKNKTTHFTKFITLIREGHSSRWVSQIRPRNRFQLKSSNGHPLNALSFHGDGNSVGQEQFEPGGKEGTFPVLDSKNVGSKLSITVVGASGDLAKKKIFPALFALYYEDCLPEDFTVFGFARTKMTDEELRNMISRTLTCRIDKRANCEDKMDQFLKRCFYHSGLYNSEQSFAELDIKLKEKEAGRKSNRLFYLSIPPNIFVDVVRLGV